MIFIIIGLLAVIIFLLVKRNNSGVERLESARVDSKEQQIYVLNKSIEPSEVVIIKPYNGSTKMAAIKAIREVNHVISLKEAKALVDNGGELEIYVAKDHLYPAEEMMGETGLEFKPKY